MANATTTKIMPIVSGDKNPALTVLGEVVEVNPTVGVTNIVIGVAEGAVVATGVGGGMTVNVAVAASPFSPVAVTM